MTMPPINPGPEAVPLNSIGERSLWNSDTMESHIPHRTDFSFRFMPKRQLGHRRLRPVIFVALTAVATAYILLLCARHLGDLNMFKGVLRSLSADNREKEEWKARCTFGGQEEPAVVAAGGELLDEEQLLKKAVGNIADLKKILQESRQKLLLMNTPTAVKVYTMLLRFSLVELVAQSSLLQPENRPHVGNAVKVALQEICFFKDIFTRDTTSITIVRQIKAIRSALKEVWKVEFAGSSISRAERLEKLSQLLMLQRMGLKQIEQGIASLAARCRQEGQELVEETAAVHLEALYETMDARRQHVLTDNVLGKWLRDMAERERRFVLGSPHRFRESISKGQMSYEEHIEEQSNTRLGLKLQQNSPSAPGKTEAQEDTQRPGPTLSTKPLAEQGKTASHSSDETTSLRASVDSGKRAGVEISAAPPSKCAGTSGRRVPPQRTSFSGKVGGSAASGIKDMSSSSGWAPSSADASSGGFTVFTPWWPSSQRDSGAFRFTGASPPLGSRSLALPATRPVAHPGHYVTSGAAKASAIPRPPLLSTTPPRFRLPRGPPPQMFGPHHTVYTHETASTTAPASAPASAPPGWLPSRWQIPQTQLEGAQFWRGGSVNPRVMLASPRKVWPAAQPTQDFRGPSAPGPPPRPTFPRGAMMQPTSQRHPSDQSHYDVRGAPIRARPPQPTAMATGRPTVMQPSVSRTGAPWVPPAATARLTRPDMPAKDFSQALPGPHGPRVPFKGMAVGEPEGGAEKRQGAPAARVAAALFPPTSSDPIASVLTHQAPSSEANQK